MASKLFIGTHYRSLDAKGRLMLPPEYRESLVALAARQPGGAPDGPTDPTDPGDLTDTPDAQAGTDTAGTGMNSADPSGPGFWLTGFYGHLTAYLPQEWDRIIDQFSRVSFRYKALSLFKSKVIGLAQFITPDAQGRIRIPQPLLREAGLEKDGVLLGMYEKFEIWDQSRFEALSTDVDISAELDAAQIELDL